MNTIQIYDTTLRDGSQGEGINFSVTDKLKIARELDAFGVHYIEGGWPGSNPKDIDFFARARGETWKSAKIAAFGSTRRKKTPVECDKQVRLLLEAETPAVAIFGKTWKFHVSEVLHTTPEENLCMITDTVRYLVGQGKEVIYDAEHAFDGYKDDPAYAFATWRAARDAGAQMIVLCDTNGGTSFPEIGAVVSQAVREFGIHVGIHTHNDCGLAVANALSAVYAGALQVQGTINGYGERTGNCNLITLIPHLAFKMKRESVPASSLQNLQRLSRFVDEVANMAHDSRQPWVGASAFAHKGGMHVNAVEKRPDTFEHIDPSLVGNARRILVGELSGRSNIVMRAEGLGIKISPEDPCLPKILEHVKSLENEGFEFETAEASLALLLRSHLGLQSRSFQVESHHVSSRSATDNSTCEASVKVKVGDKKSHDVSDGDGPVHALDKALRIALSRFYPCIENVQLVDFKVRNITAGTGAKTRVLIRLTDGVREWGTCGVHENIIDASLGALTEGLLYALTIAQ